MTKYLSGFATEILERIFVLPTVAIDTYCERAKETEIMTKYLSGFATEILERIFVLPTEAIDTYCERAKKTEIMTKYPHNISQRRF